MKKILLSTLICVLCVSLSACGNTKETKESIKVCKSAEDYDVRYQFKFTLAEDEKTIKEISFIQTVNEKNIDAVYPDKDKNEIYTAFKDDMQSQYAIYAEYAQNFSWFTATIDEKPEEYFAQLSLTFDISNKNLDLENEDTRALLGYVGVNMFYDTDKEEFIYKEKEFLDKAPLSGIYKVQCIDEKTE